MNALPKHQQSAFLWPNDNVGQPDNVNGRLVIKKTNSGYKVVGAACLFGRYDSDGKWHPKTVGYDAFMYFMTLPDRKLICTLNEGDYIVETFTETNRLITRAINDIVRLNFGDDCWIAPGIPVTYYTAGYPGINYLEELAEAMTWEEVTEHLDTRDLKHVPIEDTSEFWDEHIKEIMNG